MERETELAVIRRAYAKQVLAAAEIDDTPLEDAYATVRREDYLGRGPWQIVRGSLEYAVRYMQTPGTDPVYLYSDDLVGIIAGRQINNGKPSFQARLIAAATPRAGEHVVHVGAGVGYYSAIFAHLVGPTGRITAIEYLPELAARARVNLRQEPNVQVLQGDGTTLAFAKADVIYVNAGATRAADNWLDRLNDGGRLILPLTTNKKLTSGFDQINRGVVFRVRRRGDDYFVDCISTVAVIPCAGSRDADSEHALEAALRNGRAMNVTRLYRDDLPPVERCWLRGPRWCLAYD